MSESFRPDESEPQSVSFENAVSNALRHEIGQLTVDSLDANLLHLELILRNEKDPAICKLAAEKRRYLVYQYFALQILAAFPELDQAAQDLEQTLASPVIPEQYHEYHWQSPTHCWQGFIDEQVANYFYPQSEGSQMVKNDPYMMQVIVEEMRGHRLKKRNQLIEDCLSTMAQTAARDALRSHFLPIFVDSYSVEASRSAELGVPKEETPEARLDRATDYSRKGDWWQPLGLMPEVVNEEVGQSYRSQRKDRNQFGDYKTMIEDQRQMATDFLSDLRLKSPWHMVIKSPDFLRQPWSRIRDVLDEACWQEVTRNVALRQMAVADIRVFLSRRPHFVYQDIGLLIQAVSHYNARYFLFNYCRGQSPLMHRLMGAPAASAVERVYGE